MKEEVLKLLSTINRPGISKLKEGLDKLGYFDAPASIRYHGNYTGGLVEHSLSVYSLFIEMVRKFKLDVPSDTIIICSLFHDLCKTKNYVKVGGKWTWNKTSWQHAILSIDLLHNYIDLTDMEINIIKYHMGFYGTIEFNIKKGEYSLAGLGEVYNQRKLAKLFYFCDDMSTQFME